MTRSNRRWLVALLVISGLSPLVCVAGLFRALDEPPPMTEADARALFDAERWRFERLRDAFLSDRGIDALRADRLEWIDGCNVEPPGVGVCHDRVAPHMTRPPGVAEMACEGWAGCSREIDEPPTAEQVSAMWSIPEERAATYLEDLRALGAEQIGREARGVRVELDAWGIIPSGRTMAIVWRPAPPAELVPSLADATAASAHGLAYAELVDGWYVTIEWN